MINDSDYLVTFYITGDIALASYLAYLNFQYETIRPAHGTCPQYEFYESRDLLSAVEGYQKGNGGFKRLLGIHTRMSAIAKSEPRQIGREVQHEE